MLNVPRATRSACDLPHLARNAFGTRKKAAAQQSIQYALPQLLACDKQDPGFLPDQLVDPNTSNVVQRMPKEKTQKTSWPTLAVRGLSGHPVMHVAGDASH